MSKVKEDLMPVVELKGVKKEYMLGSTKVEALRGVDLEIEKG